MRSLKDNYELLMCSGYKVANINRCTMLKTKQSKMIACEDLMNRKIKHITKDKFYKIAVSHLMIQLSPWFYLKIKISKNCYHYKPVMCMETWHFLQKNIIPYFINYISIIKLYNKTIMNVIWIASELINTFHRTPAQLIRLN